MNHFRKFTLSKTVWSDSPTHLLQVFESLAYSSGRNASMFGHKGAHLSRSLVSPSLPLWRYLIPPLCASLPPSRPRTWLASTGSANVACGLYIRARG